MAFFAIVACAGLVYGYYVWSQGKITSLKEDITKLESTVNYQNKVIAGLERDMADIRTANDHLNQLNQDAAASLEALRKKFNEHDWATMVASKPGLVATILNEAEKQRIRCIELATGAKLTEDEKNGKVINKVCPSYFK